MIHDPSHLVILGDHADIKNKWLNINHEANVGFVAKGSAAAELCKWSNHGKGCNGHN